MIISVRGANGVGKSTLLRYMIDNDDAYKRIDKLITFCPKFNSYILGNYFEKSGKIKSAGGGFDLIGTMEEQTKLVLEAGKLADKNQKIWYEGAMTSTIFSTWDKTYRTAENTYGHKTLILFLNYKRDVCIERIIERSGDKAKYSQIDNKIYQVANSVKNLKKVGYEVLEITNSELSVLEILKLTQKKSKEIRGV